MTSGVCWGGRAGFLEEGASGGWLWDALHQGPLKLHGEGGPGTLGLGPGVPWFC